MRYGDFLESAATFTLGFGPARRTGCYRRGSRLFQGSVATILPFFQDSKGSFQRLCSARSSLAMALAAAWPRAMNAGCSLDRRLVLGGFIGVEEAGNRLELGEVCAGDSSFARTVATSEEVEGGWLRVHGLLVGETPTLLEATGMSLLLIRGSARARRAGCRRRGSSLFPLGYRCGR